MASRKMVLVDLFTGQEERHRQREQTCGRSRGRRGKDHFRAALKHIYDHAEEGEPVRTCWTTQGAQPGAL